MSRRFSLLAALISVSVCACGASAGVYAIDNNNANFEVTGDTVGCQALMNVFNTNPLDPTITQVSVAWGGVAVGASVQIVLYSVSDSIVPITVPPTPFPSKTTGGNPVNPTSYLTLLQSLSTTITAGQRNDDGGGMALNPPGGPTSSVWTTYTIPPTKIPTGRFAVGVIGYEDNATFGLVWNDDTVTATNSALVITGPASGLNADLSNVLGAGSSPNYDVYDLNGFTFNMSAYPQYPPLVTDPPYLIRAGGVPMGDATLDGTVGIDDFSVLLAHWGSTSTNWADGNFIGAGNIGIDDFSILLSNWGANSPAFGSSMTLETPEPATLVLLALGGLAILRRSRGNAGSGE